ncbi:MAG: ASPIC/UnbV domain-containing protein [Acidobacteriaceae bacterium]
MGPAAGARMINEVRSGGSYLSQNDLRLRFGLDPSHMAAASSPPLRSRPRHAACRGCTRW